MKHSNTHRGLRDLCAHPHEDDGIDPRQEKRSHSREKASSPRADGRLCKQVRQAVEHALLALGPNTPLAVFLVHSVSILRGRLCVVLHPGEAIDTALMQEAEQFASAVRPAIRAAVAHSIVRKRTPDIVIELSNCPLETGVEDE
jgi:hypothetical protein